jgi:hypothetical protein
MQGAAVGGIGVVGFLADVIVGALSLWLYRSPADSGTVRWERNLRRLQDALEGMPPDERARVYSDIQHALDLLGTRGILPDETLLRAMDAPLGMLGITMAPRDDLKASP